MIILILFTIIFIFLHNYLNLIYITLINKFKLNYYVDDSIYS